MKRAFKKGYSLAETALALSLIALVFMMALTTLLALASNYRKIANTSFFTNEMSNYLACYKKGGSAEFKDNANLLIFESEVFTNTDKDGKYVFCYDYEYRLQKGYYSKNGEFAKEYKDGCKYFLFVEINGGFYSYVVDGDGSSVAKMDKVFYSRYDL